MKTLICFLLWCATSIGCAATLVLDNQTSYPTTTPRSKIAIQWASSAKEVAEDNEALAYGSSRMNPQTLYLLKGSGTETITIPKRAAYFRVVVWSQEEQAPDFVTNWVDAVPGKTYTLQSEHLVPTVLMAGSGC